MIEIKHLSKAYQNKQVLDDVNLQLNEGQVLAVVGPSGGGKTTLLRCISGLETMDQGEILIDGQAFDPTAQQADKGRIGVVFQDFNLFPHLSVVENITLAPILVKGTVKETAEQTAVAILADLGLAGKEKQYPYELSGGQKQRVAIARALIMQPKLLCYDEPTSALDPDLRDSVAETILRLKQQSMTQIVVTHDHDFAAKIADQLIEVTPIA